MWILDELGFDGCAVPLYVVTVRKEISTEKET